ncbi:hypothetical protein F4808DRAFT_428377 [Astrocystis sublimbata]|nr:hypothetical protein F4808DRAFT_428377 [Astrocystis sublimbata]
MLNNFLTTLVAVLPLAAASPSNRLKCRGGEKGCTAISFGDFSWTIEEFTYHRSYTFSTPAHQISGGQVGFNLTNPALEGKVTCQAYSSQLSDFFYGDFIYNCQAPDGSLTETTFDWNSPASALNINQTWTCTDEDPQYPVTFHAFGSVNLTLDCKESNYQNPNWTLGETYSSRVIDCAPITLPLMPHDKTAVA